MSKNKFGVCMDSVLEVHNLTVTIASRRVIDGVSFSLEKGKVTALVGESGSGKTMTALALLNLLPERAVIKSGKVDFRGKDILKLSKDELRGIRGKYISMVFQEPFTSLNPLLKAGEQISETIAAHEKISPEELNRRVGELLLVVKLEADVAGRYPHELSGGMRQRVMLAMALSCSPEVIILDEPTTALDVSVQKHVLDLVRDIQRERHLAALFITHDLSVVNTIADKVCVMKDGKIVESGSKDEVLKAPKHAYTKHLLDCIPRLGDKRRRLPVGL
jgi:ABC-type glutathione transport system ATPase component